MQIINLFYVRWWQQSDGWRLQSSLLVNHLHRHHLWLRSHFHWILPTKKEVRTFLCFLFPCLLFVLLLGWAFPFSFQTSLGSLYLCTPHYFLFIKNCPILGNFPVSWVGLQNKYLHTKHPDPERLHVDIQHTNIWFVRESKPRHAAQAIA